MDNDDSDEEDRTIRSTQVRITGGELGETVYLLRLCLSKPYEDESNVSEIEAELEVVPAATESGKRETVGKLKGNLLRRPNPNFFETADAISQELQELSVVFCNSVGIANRIKHPNMTNSPTATNGGGFLQIYTFEIRTDHQKKDLGLRMVHETLAFLRGEWTLAVMVPGILSDRLREWPVPGVDRVRERHVEPSPEEIAENAAAELKTQKHIARMGFSQAGRSRGRANLFFLTLDQYFPAGSDPAKAMNRWISKERLETIGIFVPPEQYTPTGLDKDLADLLRGQDSSETTLIQSVADLVGRGASITGATAIHIAAANSSLGPPVLRDLIRLGGDVNSTDQDGNTPLHIAAATNSVQSIKILLAYRASRAQTNLIGETPLRCFEQGLQNTCDFKAAMGMLKLPPREIDVKPKYQIAYMLMDPLNQAQLIEDWLSPRMRTMLTITAELAGDEIRDGEFYTLSDFIPPSFQGPISDGFKAGFVVVFDAVVLLLKAGKTPTVGRIQSIGSSSATGGQAFTHMLQLGGKIEFALDALFYATERVLVDEDYGWEYETFE